MDKNLKTVFLTGSVSGLKSIINDAGLGSFLADKYLLDKSAFSKLVGDVKIKTNKTSIQADSGYFIKDDNLDKSIEILAIKKQKMILALLKSEDYIEGEITKTQLYFESVYAENPLVFREAFQNTWLELFRQRKANELRKFICIASCMDYDTLKDRADAIILAASVFEDKFVNEAALRAAEAWGDSKLALYLTGMRNFGIAWLDDYKKSVIEYLERVQ